MGYRVIEACDGQAGVRLFREARSGLVLLDMIMPEKDGIETLRDVQKCGSDAKADTERQRRLRRTEAWPIDQSHRPH